MVKLKLHKVKESLKTSTFKWLPAAEESSREMYTPCANVSRESRLFLFKNYKRLQYKPTKQN